MSELGACLRNYFGHAAFRGKQEEVLHALADGHDVLAIMPTGAGKSLLYQLPAAAGWGLVIVVSPLLALMQDQLESSRAAFERGGAGAEAVAQISSNVGDAERRRVFADLQSANGVVQLLYTTPETLDGDPLRAALRECPRTVALLAVDEAHCISSWGHDFRPSFRRVSRARPLLPKAPVLALTATATERVQRDICSQLGLGSPTVITAPLDRANLSFSVVAKDELADAAAQLGREVQGATADGGSAIVYAWRQRDTEEVASALVQAGVRAAPYHAGLPAGERRGVQQQWQSGEMTAVVATVAFGMGVNKADVRLVAHWCLPKSMEALLQESGRAGRDGLPARCVLYVGWRDWAGMERMASADDGRRKRAGAAAAAPARLPPLDPFSASPDALERAGRTRGAALLRVLRYAGASTCRRAALLAHFGQRISAAAARSCSCDVCAGRATRVNSALAAAREAGRGGSAWRRRCTTGSSVGAMGSGLVDEEASADTSAGIVRHADPTAAAAAGVRVPAALRTPEERMAWLAAQEEREERGRATQAGAARSRKRLRHMTPGEIGEALERRVAPRTPMPHVPVTPSDAAHVDVSAGMRSRVLDIFRTALRENVEACGRASLATVASAAAAIELHCAETCSGKAQYLAKMRTAHAKLGALTKAGNSFLMLSFVKQALGRGGARAGSGPQRPAPSEGEGAQT